MDTDLDDFADDKAIQEQRRAQREHAEMIKACEALLNERLGATPASCADIEAFLTYKSFDSPRILDSYKSDSGRLPIEVYLLEYHWSLRVAKSRMSGNEQCFLGVLSFQKDYPLTCIYRETLQMKISNWFTRQDLNLIEGKKFSHSFYIASKDKEKLRNMLLGKHLDDLAAFSNAEIELNGSHCIFRASDQPVSVEEAKKFIELAGKLCKIFS